MLMKYKEAIAMLLKKKWKREETFGKDYDKQKLQLWIKSITSFASLFPLSFHLQL